jgi:hypothetical protein
MDNELGSLLERLRTAPEDRIDEYVDRVAAGGEGAVAAVRPWLEQAQLARRAVRVIEATAKHGLSNRRVCTELGRIRVTPKYAQADTEARAARARLRCPAGPTTPAGPDNRWRQLGNRMFMRAEGQWHVVDGTTVADGEVTRYFTVCHRWNSRGYIEGAEEGGLRREAPATELLCTLCRNAELGGYRQPGSLWRTRSGVRADGTHVTHLWHDESRHVAKEPAPTDSPDVGPVYLTNCGHIVEYDRVTVRQWGVPPPPDLRPCENCEPPAEAGTTAPAERG